MNTLKSLENLSGGSGYWFKTYNDVVLTFELDNLLSRNFEKNGLVKGSFMGIKRICSCHPIKILGGGKGFDPVKKKGS